MSVFFQGLFRELADDLVSSLSFQIQEDSIDEPDSFFLLENVHLTVHLSLFPIPKDPHDGL